MRSLGAKPIHILNRSMTAVARLVAVGELTKGPRWEHRQLSRRDAEQSRCPMAARGFGTG